LKRRRKESKLYELLLTQQLPKLAPDQCNWSGAFSFHRKETPMIVFKNKDGRKVAIAPYDGISIEENDKSTNTCRIHFGGQTYQMPGSFEDVLAAVEADGAEIEPEPETDEIDGENPTEQETQPN
jgi:hypothetical protein